MENVGLLPGLAAAIERMGDEDMYREIAASFAEALPGTANAIAGAMNDGNWNEARRLVHSLKGNCAAMGAETVRETVYALEKACAAHNETAARDLFHAVSTVLPQLREELLAV